MPLVKSLCMPGSRHQTFHRCVSQTERTAAHRAYYTLGRESCTTSQRLLPQNMNHKHKSTLAPCSSDYYPRNTFSDNYRAKIGSTLQPLPFSQEGRGGGLATISCRVVSHSGLLVGSKKFLGRYSSQNVVMLTRTTWPSCRP